MTLPTQLLSYAPRRRRWVLRWMKRSAAVLVLLAIFAAEWRFGPAGWHSARIWYWERECYRIRSATARLSKAAGGGSVRRWR
jgi:hypothetical protein